MQMLKRYLWALGDGIKGYKSGSLIGDRYRLVQSNIVLDTKPEQLPEIPEEMPPEIARYLKLSPQRLHIPQVYGKVSLTNGRNRSELWLLEYGLLRIKGNEEFEKRLPKDHLFPMLTQMWQNASPMRQLNWLWQMAQLWQPLSKQGVVSSLFNPSLLRVNGAILQLKELQLDEAKLASTHNYLKGLGALWEQWESGSSPFIAQWLHSLSSDLKGGKITHSEQLIAVIDKALAECGRSQRQRYEICTRTDTGRSRTHNEDACYPPDGNVVKTEQHSEALAIVCDGIGGHEGGEIASKLAIEEIKHEIEKLSLENALVWEPSPIINALDASIRKANDAISDRNDTEQRSDRRRMGTTLVMTLPNAPYMYTTHVGDSRVYWMTRTGCYQLTVDDDVASREVRLGYALYRDAIQYPSSGALVQALGMSSSDTLHPTVQRLVLDEDSVFLLCSDGLSDNDRVEQNWESEILPLLDHKANVEQVAERLIRIANTQNGHDNITVAVVHCKVQPTTQTEFSPLSLPFIEAPPPSSNQDEIPFSTSTMQTQEFSEAPKRTSSAAAIITLSLLLGLGIGVLGYFVFAKKNDPPTLIGVDPSPLPSQTTSTPPPSPSPKPTITRFSVNSQWKISQAYTLYPTLNETGSPNATIPTGTILKILETQGTWLRVQACQPETSPTPPTASPNSDTPIGWIQDVELKRIAQAPTTTPISCQPVTDSTEAP